MDAIIQDLRADRIYPENFVSSQDFDHRVKSFVKDAVDPVHNALRKDLDEMKRTYLLSLITQ